MKRPLLLAFAVLLVAIAAGLWFRTPGSATSPTAAAAPAPAASAPASAQSATTAESATPQAARQVAAASSTSAKPADFAFRRLDIDTSREVAAACLVFSEKLAGSGVRYDDFLRFTPPAVPAIRVAGDRLCFEGLAFGREYQVELKPGLPAASGATLAAAETVPVELRDRPPLVAFRDGLILPRESGSGVPVTTVNVETVALKVYRVPDRLVSQLRPEQFAERQVGRWRINEIANEQGALIWSGEMPVRAAKNETVTSIFPLNQAVPDRRPGIYVVTARNLADTGDGDDEDDYRQRTAIQWLVETDIGLTSFKGEDGLHVFARSYRTATPLAGIEVALVSRSNDELARATTDAEGHVRFAPGLLRGTGGAQAEMTMAYGAAGDFAFQDLRRPAFDLSDRGVEGRDLPGPVDAFLYTDRGVYRPGETVQLVALLRDRVAAAIEGTQLVLSVQRPDGVEYRKFVLPDGGAGARHLALPLTDTAPRGRWQALAYVDAGGKPAGRVEFDVDDFIPQKLKVTLEPPQDALHPGDAVRVGVEAQFLYGAPAAGLDGEGEMRISADPEPFPTHKGYRFGLVEESFDEQILPLEVATTDEAGRTAAEGRIEGLAETTLPLRAALRIGIFEPGGRATDQEATLPVRTRPVAIGIRPLFKGGRIPEDTEAAFEVIAVDESGAPVARDKLAFELVEERTDYHWYRGDRGWRYERITRDRSLDAGNLAVAADAPATFRRTMPWGYYRLTVKDPASGAATSIRFSAGWRGVLAEDRPDRVEVAADKESYKPGETARIAIRPPVAGEALLVVASDRVFETRLVSVPAEGTTVEVKASADWGSGAYAVVAHYRPLSPAAVRAPVRAIGVSWLQLDASDRTLEVALAAPDTMRPRQRLTVPVTVAGAAGEKTFLTLAAIDEGILQLTEFASPAPERHYFGKRRLAVDIRDDYGRLIDTRNGILAQLRQGGDAIGGRGLEVVPTKTVALFSGPVALDDQGKAEVALDIPDFNGELRLMAVAWSARRLGSATGKVTVRDPVVADAVLPRFLAPGDESRLSLNLHNVDGEAGAYRVRFTASGPVGFTGETEKSFDLPVGKRELAAFPVAARESGIATIALELSGPGFAVRRDWQIEVRPPQAPVTSERVTRLAAGAETRLDRSLVASAVPGTGKVTVSLSSYRLFDIAALLQALDRYPFGCLEQTTSRAFPLLVFNDLALLGGTKQDRGIEGRVQDAVNRVLDMQTYEGDFGMWSAGSYRAQPWLSLYALDFLAAAKAKGYAVPDDAMRRGQAFLRGYAASPTDDPKSIAYAHYLLARGGNASPGEMRLFNDTTKRFDMVGDAFLANALLQIGDRARATVRFRDAEQLVGRMPRNLAAASYRDDYYGSPLRDLAAVTALAAEAKQTAMIPTLVERIGQVGPLVDRLTTQEKSWLLLAAGALTRDRGKLAVTVDGAAPDRPGDPVNVVADAARLERGLVLRNAGDREIWQTVSVTAVPRDPLPASAQGVTIERRFYTLTGEDADPTLLRQNDRMIVSLSGAATDDLYHEFVLLDLLPAGWEIEAIVRGDDEGKSPYVFLPKMRELRVREARDDRFVAAFDIDASPDVHANRWAGDEDQEKNDLGFHVAYIVRAVTPGTYALPPSTVEDMYRPSVKARTAMGRVTVLPRE